MDKDSIQSFFRSLLTRKFLLAFGTFLTFVANGQYNEAVAVVIAYIGAEGIGDAAERFGNKQVIKEITTVPGARR